MVGGQIKRKALIGKTYGRLRLIINAKRLPWPQNYKIFSNAYASGKVIFPKTQDGNNVPFMTEDVSTSQSRDSGLALVLISLILAWGVSTRFFLLLGIGLLVVTMTAPGLFRPFAKVWFGLSHALGTVVSRILLTILFYAMVTPVGFIRRLLGKDAMQLKSWKEGRTSVFQTRDHLFTNQDLDHPY